MRELLPLLCALAFALPLAAQEEVNPATKPGQVQIVFLPPPMEGTVSLGIYTKAGKLVRALKREANPEKDFVVGLNGLITIWDGKNDQGAAAPKGVYSVRGYMVHAIGVSGEAFHCNDWITADDAPHPKEITKIGLTNLRATDGPQPPVRLFFDAKLADGKEAGFVCTLEGQVRLRKKDETWSTVESSEGKPGAGKGPDDKAAFTEAHEIVDSASGKDGSAWLIDRSPERVEVQQYSAKGEFLRRLSIAAGEPVPEKIAASTTSDLIFLLERGEGIQRVRGLALETLKAPLPAEPIPEGEPKASTWRIVFSKSIRACSDYATAAPHLGRAEVAKPETTLAIKLAKNPLGKKVEPTMECTVACEPKGSFLHTADGLPLCRLTDTPGLLWAVLTRAGKDLMLIQSDGAVVEEYKLGKLTSMMAFDAGDYELK